MAWRRDLRGLWRWKLWPFLIRADGLFSIAALLIAFPLLALDPYRTNSQYLQRAYKVEQGLPQNSARCLAQSPEGLLWIGTQEGVARWDGDRFAHFNRRNTSAIQDNFQTALTACQDGGVWSANLMGLVRIEAQGKHRRIEGLPRKAIRALLEDRKGRLWIAFSEGGAALWDKGQIQLLPQMTPHKIQTWVEESNGSLWALGDRELLRWIQAEGRFETQILPAGRCPQIIAPSRPNGLWVLTQDALVHVHNTNQTIHSHVGLDASMATSLLEDRQGQVWLGKGKGLWRGSRQGNKVHWSNRDLPQEEVLSLLEDREGSLWVGHARSGLLQIRDGRLIPFGAPEGLPHTFIISTVQDKDGSLLLGTRGGGLIRMKDGRFESIQEGLPHPVVKALALDAAQALWVGTPRGLVRREGHIFKNFGKKEGLEDPLITCLSPDPDGRLWIGTRSGLQFFREGRIHPPILVKGRSVVAVHRDRKGRLWIGTDGDGLHCFQGEERVYTWPSAGPPTVIWDIHEDEGGQLWFATYDRGLLRFKDGRFQNLDMKAGLPDDLLFQVLEDNQRNLWFSGNRGMSCLARSQAEAVLDGRISTVSVRALDPQDGLRCLEFTGGNQHAGFKDREGRLWFPSIDGLFQVPCNQPKTQSRPNETLFMGLEANGRMEWGNNPNLPPGLQRLQIHFTFPSLSLPHQVRFRYRLEPLDQDWTESPFRTAHYRHLPPGEYRFQVEGRDGEHTWSGRHLEWNFQVQPHVWERPTFKLLLLFLGGLSLWGLHRIRIRHLQAREAHLARLVQERTCSLETEKEHSEKARLEALKAKEVAEKADRAKTELLTIAAHDLKNPLQNILCCVDLIEMEEPPPPIPEDLERIRITSRQMLDLVNAFLQSARYDEANLAVRIDPLNLGAFLPAVLARNRPSAERKGQILILEEPYPFWVLADQDRLEEVLDNLLSNAIKYSPHGKRIWLRARETITSIEIEIQDEGPGLTVEDQSRLFGRFQRLSAKPTGGESSSGIGLAIVKRLVELQHGRIWAASEGGGARFVVELPRRV